MAAFDVIREDTQLYPPSYMPQRGIDYLYSPSRLHIAVLEENGDFTIYRGESPDDPGRKQVWSSGSSNNKPPGYVVVAMHLRAGPFDRGHKKLQIFAHDPARGSTLTQIWASGGSSDLAHPVVAMLGDDGNLTLRQNDQVIWSNGYSDPVLEFIIESIEYDLPRGTIKTDNEADVLEQSLANDGTVVQSMQMSRSTSTSVTSSWSNATGLSATIGGEVTAGVPGVASAKVTMSATVSNTFTLGGSHSTTATIGFSFNLNVPPKTTYRGWASIRQAVFEVPYTAIGELHFKSGAKLRHRLHGIYEGKTGYLGVYHVDDVTEGKPRTALVFRSEGPGAMTGLVPAGAGAA